MKNYLNNLKLLAILSVCLMFLGGSGCLKAKTKTDDPRHIAWGSAGDTGYSNDVIQNYDWMVIDTSKYICKEK